MVCGSASVGTGIVLQHTPRAVTGEPPVAVTFPPPIALVWVMRVTGEVTTVGGAGAGTLEVKLKQSIPIESPPVALRVIIWGPGNRIPPG